MADLSPELGERCAQLVRKLVDYGQTAVIEYALAVEARAIVAELPQPVDPDLIEARRIIGENYGSTRMHDGSLALGEGPQRVENIKAGKGDEYWEMRVVLAAIKRGRELERAALATTPERTL